MSARAPRVAIAVALAALLSAASAPPASAKRVRVFAVGPRFGLDWVDSRAHFHDKLFALFDRRRRVAGAPVVQRGADDVASHLLGPADRGRPVQTARDLVALPEDLGLMAAFSGSRGAGARTVTAQTGGLVGAIATLLGSYAPVTAYYAQKYPQLTTRPLPTRLLALALTDTFARVAVETYAELAATYRVYLEGGVNMAQSWKVVCDDKATFKPLPGGVGCDEQNPSKVSELRSPDEPSRDYAYEATSPNPSNMALVFDPQGRLISKQVKTYTTPTEAPNQLDLVPGSVSGGLSALRTPVGTLGFVTSKDAWMPDVTAKLDEGHVDLLVQPEFFVNDTVRARDDSGRLQMWSPDTLKAAGYSDVLRHPSIDALVLAELTGNVYDFSADAQQHIVVKPRSRSGRPRGHLVGQPDAPGYDRVAQWLVADPLRAGEPYAQRRARLGAAGEKALPLGDGPACPSPDVAGPCKGGQVEGVLWADVRVGDVRRRRPLRRRKRARTPFTVNRPVSPSRFPQRNVSLAARGHTVWAAFEERRRGRDQVYLVRSRDGGRHWSGRVRPRVHSGRRSGAAEEWWPSVAAGPGGRVWVAWQDDSSGVPRVYFSYSDDGGRRFSRAAPVDPSAPAGAAQWKPSVAASERGRAVVAWVDERGRQGDDQLPQAGIFAARLRGASADPAGRLDEAVPVDLAKPLANAWAPSVAASGSRVTVAWIDFHTYDWRAYERSSQDGARTFGPERDLTDAARDTDASGAPIHEVLDDAPSAAITSSGPLVAFTDFRKRESAGAQPHQLYDIYAAAPGGKDFQVDAHGSAQLDSFSPSLVALPRGGALVAWQDHGRGPGEALIARLSRGRRAGRARRIADISRTGSDQWRPQLARAGSRIVGAWEDDRDGPPQVFAATARTAAIR